MSENANAAAADNLQPSGPGNVLRIRAARASVGPLRLYYPAYTYVSQEKKRIIDALESWLEKPAHNITLKTTQRGVTHATELLNDNQERLGRYGFSVRYVVPKFGKSKGPDYWRVFNGANNSYFIITAL